jgi:fluoroacetyl-CoA thioesterase
MPDIPVGTTFSSVREVTDANAISFLGDENARVLATPWLILYLEMTARDAVKPYLSDGEDTVGTQVNVRHLAATPIGCQARFAAEVLTVDGRRVQFRVEAWDEQGKIAEGTHERAVIRIREFAKRMAAKRSAAAAPNSPGADR